MSARIFVSLSIIVMLSAAISGLQALGSASRLNIIILTVESARQDAMSPETTPTLWRHSESAIRFENHRAVSAWTAPNIVSILTGRHPAFHSVHTRGQTFVDGPGGALKQLSQQGYHTSGLQPFMLVDVFRGFGLAVEAGADPLYWLAERADDEKPFLLWYHYLPTHLPYRDDHSQAPDWRSMTDGDPASIARIGEVTRQPALPHDAIRFQPSDQAAISALYQGGFKQFDEWFSNVWDFLNRSGLRRNTVIILTADHGEELLERGMVGHASTTRNGHLHEEIVRVPMFLWLPETRDDEGLASTNSVTDHLDIMPTIFDLLGQDAPADLPGRSLFSGSDVRYWSAMSTPGGYADIGDASRPMLHAVSDGIWKLHFIREDDVLKQVRLFDLSVDPAEARDLAEGYPEHVARLLASFPAPRLQAERSESDMVSFGAIGDQPPAWLEPSGSGRFTFGDTGGRIRFVWQGVPDTRYRLQYQVGTGILGFDGEIDVEGTTKDFGRIDEAYWDQWIVPYSPFRVRVGYAGSEPLWSEWLELEAQ